MSYSLGQTPPPAESTPANFADWVMFGGIATGFVALLVGGVVGQNRLWTKDMRRNGRRRRSS